MFQLSKTMKWFTMRIKCSSCGLPTHEQRLTKLKDNRNLCFECMNKQFKVTKLSGVYYFEEETTPNKCPMLRVVSGRPLYNRKKVFKRFKDPTKRGVYNSEQNPKKKYLYEH
jgi:hypothetical protein